MPAPLRSNGAAGFGVPVPCRTVKPSRTAPAPGSGTQANPYSDLQYALAQATTVGGDTVLVFADEGGRAQGFLLPRDADLQFVDRRLRSVSRARLGAGDLVFFGPRRGAITHVGIALGPRAFVNATTHGVPVVRVDALNDTWWRGLYRGARRLP